MRKQDAGFDFHRYQQLLAEAVDLTQRQATLHSGSSGAADQVLSDEAMRLRAVEGLVPVHGPGVVIVIDATSLKALDLQDALNNLSSGGAEAIAVNDRRVVAGVPIENMTGGVAIDGQLVRTPWTITTIGDPNRIAEVANLMTQDLRADRRVRQASYRVEIDVAIQSVISEKPFVYAISS